jgi:hypothetical protein
VYAGACDAGSCVTGGAGFSITGGGDTDVTVEVDV